MFHSFSWKNKGNCNRNNKSKGESKRNKGINKWGRLRFWGRLSKDRNNGRGFKKRKGKGRLLLGANVPVRFFDVFLKQFLGKLFFLEIMGFLTNLSVFEGNWERMRILDNIYEFYLILMKFQSDYF